MPASCQQTLPLLHLPSFMDVEYVTEVLEQVLGEVPVQRRVQWCVTKVHEHPELHLNHVCSGVVAWRLVGGGGMVECTWSTHIFVW